MARVNLSAYFQKIFGTEKELIWLWRTFCPSNLEKYVVFSNAPEGGEKLTDKLPYKWNFFLYANAMVSAGIEGELIRV